MTIGRQCRRPYRGLRGSHPREPRAPIFRRRTAGLAIVNGTLAAAIGLGLQQWIAGIVVWAVGHSIAVFAARRDPAFAPVLVRHLRQRSYLAC
jgi:type IV secretory pathway TrbD component